MPRSLLSVIFIMLFLPATNCLATVIFQPTAISTNADLNFIRGVSNTIFRHTADLAIDGSGLLTRFESGVTDYDEVISTVAHISPNGTGQRTPRLNGSFFGASPGIQATSFFIDLGEEMLVSKFALWFDTNGGQDFEIFSTDSEFLDGVSLGEFRADRGSGLTVGRTDRKLPRGTSD